MNGGYERLSWSALCREVAKLKMAVLDGKVLPLSTDPERRERKARNRWRNLVTPSGLES